jgi:EAL domain-containing protein (putative c-di-GMP-specific phosphodiesterase class I)
VATARVQIEVDLRHAFERSELAVWYQPEVDLTTGGMPAVEALLRWHHPDGTTWVAGRFADVAERTGLILDIGDWVLREACVQGAQWAALAPDPALTVRVNVSALQLAEGGLLDALDDALKASQLDPKLLCLEITETALLHQTAVATGNVAGIRERGVRIAIDDFGTGYASLSYLRDYPIDILKIDRSFVTNIATNVRDARIVSGIIALARALKIDVTAEGVENQEQAELLRLLGCPAAQGFLFSEAVSPDRITERLAPRP